MHVHQDLVGQNESPEYSFLTGPEPGPTATVSLLALADLGEL